MLAILIFSLSAVNSAYTSDIVHIIKKGETVYSLSKQYNIPMNEILKHNKIKDASKIKTGQKLYIPVKENSSTAIKKYKIQKGDTIYGIAKKFGVKRAQILNLNGLTEKSVIKVGQVLKIPSVKRTVSENKINTSEFQNYIAKKGDTLYGIAKKFGIKGADLLKINGLTENYTLKPGKVLKIPSETKILADENFKPAKKINVKPPADLHKYSTKKGDTNLLWPIAAKKVSYISGKIYGVAIEGSDNEGVKAIASGKVVSSGPYRGYGNVVFIKGKTKHIYVYGGLNQVTVKIGDKIPLGKKIGTLSSDGILRPAKLYFMVYEKNKPIDPAKAPRGL